MEPVFREVNINSNRLVNVPYSQRRLKETALRIFLIFLQTFGCTDIINERNTS